MELPPPPAWLAPIVPENGCFADTIPNDGELGAGWFSYHPSCSRVCIDAELTPKQLRELADYIEAMNACARSDAGRQ